MLEQDVFALRDRDRIRDLVRDHAWATLVTPATAHGPVVSHLPVLVRDPDGAPELTLLGHLARTDAEQHELGRHDVVVIVQGPNGYISPRWYGTGPHVPTWNFVVAHIHGRPEVLDADETYAVLSATVDHFEERLPEPWRLSEADAYAHRIARAATGFRLPATRVAAKAKLSQDESESEAGRIVRALESEQPYTDRRLARAMRETWSRR